MDSPIKLDGKKALFLSGSKSGLHLPEEMPEPYLYNLPMLIPYCSHMTAWNKGPDTESFPLRAFMSLF